jgi:hypothetical protein
VVNIAAEIMCVHGGKVMLIPKQTTLLVGGAPALRATDLIGAPIVGCALPPSPVTVPCTAVVSEIPIPGVGVSATATNEELPLMLQGITGITDSVPPGTFLCASAGQETVLA